jgi:hypothetical protein
VFVVAVLDMGLLLCCCSRLLLVGCLVALVGAVLGKALVVQGVVVLWGLLVDLGVAVLVACVLGKGLVQTAWWIVELLVAHGAL